VRAIFVKLSINKRADEMVNFLCAATVLKNSKSKTLKLAAWY
jgi:hypothetical protein